MAETIEWDLVLECGWQWGVAGSMCGAGWEWHHQRTLAMRMLSFFPSVSLEHQKSANPGLCVSEKKVPRSVLCYSLASMEHRLVLQSPDLYKLDVIAVI